MTFFWRYELARDKYAYSKLYNCSPYSCKKRESKDTGGMKYTLFCLEISDAKSR